MENSTLTTAKTLLVYFSAKDSQSAEELKYALNYLADISKNEEGFIRYEVFMSDNNRLDYYVLQTWTGERSLERHLNQNHVLEFAAQCKLMLARPFSIVPLSMPFKAEWLKPLLTSSIGLN